MALKHLFSMSILVLLPFIVLASHEPCSKYEEPLYGVQGVIFCTSCNKFTPIKGAVAKIVCETKMGYKPAMFSMLTPKTDKNGYFLATLTPKQLGEHLKPTDCKVYLESSPSYTCNIPTNTNLGLQGASLVYSNEFDNYMGSYDMKLFSVPAFTYTSTKKCEVHHGY